MVEEANISGTIVVAYDGSPAARSAATVAIQLAHSQHLQVRGVYVEEAAVVLDPYPNYQAELGATEHAADHRELLSRFEERGRTALLWLESQCRAATVAVTSTIAFGRVPTIALEEATTATLLALGRRGHGHATDPDHLGRHFHSIARGTRQPLLIGGNEARPVQHVLLAYNESERAQRALSWAALLQRTLPAEVLVLAVQDDPSSTQRSLEAQRARLAESQLVNYGFLSRSGEPAIAIVTMAAEHRSDLIIMGGYRHGALLEWLIGSTVDHVLLRSPLPVLLT
jgi:nucleotide-binding universal stress UspA family protein